MVPDACSDTDGIPLEHGSPQQDQVDRQMIRHLLGRYSKEELGRLLQEEDRTSAASPYNDASFVLAGRNSAGRSAQDESPNAFDSSASGHTFSDTSSVASNLSPRPSHFHNRRRNASPSTNRVSMALTDDSSWDAEDITPTTTTVPKPKGSFTCGFCLEEGIQKTCTRKNDLKRHMEDFHHTNAQWFCRHRGCQMVFDWQTAYKAHLKSSHGGSRMNLDDAKVALCPQTVFACGFENCLRVFEAPSDVETGPTFKEYVSHVVKHFDEGASSGQWSYSSRLRNLLRQSGVLSAWPHSMWPESEQSRLRWSPQESSILRKRLETRHLGDLQFLVQYAIALGSSPSGTIQSFRADFVTPIRSECRMAIHGHNRVSIASATPTPDPDHMQYGISANGASQAMGYYYASQRQAYIHQQPTQPPLHSPAYSFYNAPPSPGYDNNSHQALQQQQQQQQQHQHQQQQQQHYAIMGQSKSDQPYMGMPSNQMVGADYVPHVIQNMPGPYAAGGMHSPAPTDEMCTSSTSPGSNMEQQQRAAYATCNSSPYAY